MSRKIINISPESLRGPRSFFTDIDPTDQNYDRSDAVRKLKLQLLTKERIIIAASSLFHDIGLEIFNQHPDLIKALEDGIIVPAIRTEFDGVEAFFRRKVAYKSRNKDFFVHHVAYSVPWDLQENSSWFKEHFFKTLSDPNSVLRKSGGLSENEAASIAEQLNGLINAENDNNQFLQRSHIQKVAKHYAPRLESFLNNYANLVYRLSGARVVNSEGHFPQSNLTKLEIIENEKVLSDESIFWDIYSETVFSYLGTAIRLTPDRLDNLAFEDILKIRTAFFDIGFSRDYDKLIALVKSKTDIADPDRLILHMHEILHMATALRDTFSHRVKSELSKADTHETENALWQVANALSLLASDTIGIIVGTVSTLISIPEITTQISRGLAKAMQDRLSWMRAFVNTRLGWSDSQKKSFLEAYKTLASYGLK